MQQQNNKDNKDKRKKLAFVFPGQGSQFIGMGKILYDTYSEARYVFEEVDDALEERLSAQIFEGQEDELVLTRNAQPAIMAVSIAALSVTLQSFNNDKCSDLSHSLVKSNLCEIVAGHSLGEYSALCAAGSFSITQTAKLLRIRGDAMQNAAPRGVGAMLALLGADYNQAVQICDEVLKVLKDKGDVICQIANDNGAGQIVLSGHDIAIEQAMIVAKDMGVRRSVKLPVSAPFHSSLISSAEKVMENAFADIEILSPVVPVIANYDAQPNQDAKRVRSLLVRQIANMVRWRETIEYIISMDLWGVVEFGPGKTLTTLLRRILKASDDYDLKLFNVCSPEEVDLLLNELTK